MPVDPLKIVLLGDAQVGKSALLHRFLGQELSEGHTYQPTFLVDYRPSSIILDDALERQLRFWEIGSSDPSPNLKPYYMAHASVALICCDLHNKQSFENITSWIQQLKTLNNPPKAISIVGFSKKGAEPTVSAQVFEAKVGALKMTNNNSHIESRGILDLRTCASENISAILYALVKQVLSTPAEKSSFLPQEGNDFQTLQEAYMRHSHSYSFFSRCNIFYHALRLKKPVGEVISTLQQHAEKNPKGASAKTLKDCSMIVGRYSTPTSATPPCLQAPF